MKTFRLSFSTLDSQILYLTEKQNFNAFLLHLAKYPYKKPFFNSFYKMSPQSRYKKEKSLEERKEESAGILRKYEGHIPVIVDKDPKCQLPDIERQKFLVPADLTIGHFVFVVRKRINLQSSDAIFIFVNKKLPSQNATIGQLYNDYKDEDGFMYCTYSSDTAYGAGII